MFKKRLNRLERREFQKQKLAQNLAGTGLYVYENNTSGTLKLPKATDSGKRVVAPKEQFQGDSYFMSLVKPPNNLLKLVRVITQDLPENQTQTLVESNMNEQKLILDQPDRVTSEGTVEQVVVKQPAPQKLNDSVEKKQAQPKEVLLTEDPMDGIEIILG
jgi:hypothetical protein